MSIADDLKSIGFEDTQATVYQHLVGFGFRTAGQILAYTDEMSLDDIQTALRQLEEKGFLKRVDGKTPEGNVYIPVAPSIALSADISQKLSSKLQNLNKKVIEQWNDTQNKIDGNLQEFLKENEKSLSNYFSKSDKRAKENITDLNTLREKQTQLTTNVGEEVQVALKQDVVPTVNSTAEQLIVAAEQVVTTKDEAISSLTTATEKHNTAVTEASKLAVTEIQEFTQELGMSVKGRVMAATQSMASVRTPTDESLENLNVQIAESITQHAEVYHTKIAGLSQQHITDAEQAFSNEEKGLATIVTDTSASVQGSIDEIETATAAAEKSAVDSSTNLLKKIGNTLQQNATTLKKGLDKAVSTTQKTSVEGLSQILDKTATDLTTAESSLTNTLQTGQNNLKGKLSDLSTELSGNLDAKFSQVVENNNSFKDNLSGDTNESVDHIVAELDTLYEFIKDFLKDTQTKLAGDLSDLDNSLNEKLTSILEDAADEREQALTISKTKVQEISSDAENKIDNFNTKLGEFLEEIKNKLSTRISNSQDQFNSTIEASVDLHKQQASQILKKQQEQIEEINKEAVNLTELAENRKEKFVNEFDTILKDAKDANLDQFTTNANNSIDRAEREVNNLKESSTTTFDKFFNKFEENVRGLKDDIPERLESLLTNHADRLQDFNREFISFKTKTSAHLNSLLRWMEENPKRVAKKSDEQQRVIEEHKRLISDFTRLSSKLEPFLKNEMEDTEQTQNEVLDDLNRTILKEINQIEKQINSMKDELNGISDSIITNLKNYQKQYVTEISTQTVEVISRAEEKISSGLTSLLLEPLNDIVSKAKHLATGTEAMGEENRVIASQNQLLEAINDSVAMLAESLKEAYTNTLNAITEEITNANTESRQLSEGNLQNINDSLDLQLKTITEFSNKMGSVMDDVTASTQNQLKEAIKVSNANVGDIVTAKSEEIGNLVATESNKLKEDTKERLNNISDKFTAFNDELISSKEQTTEELNSTVSTAQTDLDDTVKEMIGALNNIVNNAKTALQTSRTSLAEEVGTPLKGITADVSKLVTQFQKEIEKHTKTINKQIAKTYKNSLLQVANVVQQGKEIQTAAAQFQTNTLSIKQSVVAQLQNLYTTVTSALNEETESYQTATLSEFAANVALLTQYVESTFMLVETQLSELEVEVGDATERAMLNSESHVQNSVEQIRKDIVGATDKVTAVLETSSTTANDALRNIADALTEKTAEYETFIDKTVSTQIKGVNNAYSEAVTALQNSIEDQKKQYSENIKNINTDFTEKLVETNNSGKETITESLENIPTIVEETLAAAGKSMKLLNSISKGAATIQPKFAETSYIDASKDAIIANLNGVISRAKSKIDIITPTVRWFDPDLAATYRRIQITIVTDPEMHNDKDAEIIKKLKDSGTQIKLKKLDKSRHQFRAGLDMILVSRDTEEAMMSLPVENKEPYGFVTQNDEFVNQINYLVGNFQVMPAW